MAFLLLLITFALIPLASAWSALVWWRKRRFVALMKKQGVRGPAPHWLAGNIIQEVQLLEAARASPSSGISHDIVSQVTPEIALWSTLYGKQYLTWYFSEPRITVSDPDRVKEVMSKQFDIFTKSKPQLEFVVDLIGRGMVGVNGDEWFHHRTILSPAFQTHKVKKMVSSIQNCTLKLVDLWKSSIKNGQTEVEVSLAMKTLAADIISHTAFGSSYDKGGSVFEMLTILGDLLTKRFHFSWLPLFRYLPMPLNFQIWKLQREMDRILLSLIEERRSLVKSGAAMSFGNDLLGLMLEESEKPGSNKSDFDDQALVDECKTFYLGGHDTIASLITWALLLLAINPEWQDRARAEAQEHCSDGFQDGDVLGKLRVMTMILYETLRLYPSVPVLLRAATKDTYLSGLKIPRGTGVTISILSLHLDKELWGPDVNEFNPERFANGTAKASRHPNGFAPFSMGPRVCIAQTLVLMEVKVIMSMLLNRFSFTVSPSYVHKPTTVSLVTLPYHGVQLLVEEVA